MVSEKSEDYLEAILYLSQFSERITSRNVAEKLGITQPSVVTMFKRLDRENLVRYTKYSGVTLTRRGRSVANAAKIRREVFSRLFEVMGFDESLSDTCARCISSCIPPESIIKVDEFTDFLVDSEALERWKEILEKKG